MNLTSNEQKVLEYIKQSLDGMSSVPYIEIVDGLNMESRRLRGIVSSLVKKNVIRSIENKDAGMTFIELV